MGKTDVFTENDNFQMVIKTVTAPIDLRFLVYLYFGIIFYRESKSEVHLFAECT